jgi:uroporphyrinogen decarboxylase
MGAPELDPSERLLRSCRGEPVDRPPVWLMRQAGRYLPEYRRVRAGIDFLEMCRDVDRAVEVSLQPVRLVGSEAVILFSDIFVPVPPMGVELDFRPGPVIADPIRELGQVEALRVPDPREAVPFVFEILRTLRQELEPDRIPLLGFAGAPFTLAAYLVEGGGSKDFSALKRMMVREPEVLRALLARLTELVVAYLEAQVEAGAQAVQLFDTWADVNNGAHVFDRMLESGADVLSVDWRVDLADAARRAGSRVSLQGNLDPCALHAPRQVIFEKVRELAEAARSARGHILNLGHGCLPDTPVEGVRAFTDAARALAGAAP